MIQANLASAFYRADHRANRYVATVFSLKIITPVLPPLLDIVATILPSLLYAFTDTLIGVPNALRWSAGLGEDLSLWTDNTKYGQCHNLKQFGHFEFPL